MAARPLRRAASRRGHVPARAPRPLEPVALARSSRRPSSLATMPVRRNAAPLQARVSGHRRVAGGAEAREIGTLGQRARRVARIVERGQMTERRAIVDARLERQDPLPDRGDEDVRIEELAVRRGSAPSRSRPAAASTIASKSPASSLRSRVSTLPRIGWTSRSGRNDRTTARRRGLEVPTTAPAGSVARVAGPRATRASRARARGGYAPSVSPRGCSAGRSLRLCTARSISLRSSASSISRTNSPLPPTRASRASACRSPSVRIDTISTSTPPAVRRSATSRAWTSASALARVPRRITCAVPGRTARGRAPAPSG